jgi:hypothetical protein
VPGITLLCAGTVWPGQSATRGPNFSCCVFAVGPAGWLLSMAAAVGLAGATVLLPVASASAATKFVQMHFACALKTTGQMSYVSQPSQCAKDQRAVTIAPGPILVCVHPNRTVYRVPVRPLSRSPQP